MNNLENKLRRMACAIVLSGRPYDANFKSIGKFSERTLDKETLCIKD